MKRMVFGFVMLTFALLACDQGNDAEINKEPSFNYHLYDEEGQPISKVSDESVDEIRIDESIALWGNRFYSERMQEMFEERSGRDLPDINQIHLYAEDVDDIDSDYAYLSFTLPTGSSFTPGEFTQPTIDTDDWLEMMERRSEMMQDQRGGRNLNSRSEGFATSMMGYHNSDLLSASYSESGFGRKAKAFLSLESSLTIDNVSEEYIEGEFRMLVAGISMEKLMKDSFPEIDELDIIRYEIVGSFTAEKGGFEELRHIRAPCLCR